MISAFHLATEKDLVIPRIRHDDTFQDFILAQELHGMCTGHLQKPTSSNRALDAADVAHGGRHPRRPLARAKDRVMDKDTYQSIQAKPGPRRPTKTPSWILRQV